jgi:pectate lyase
LGCTENDDPEDAIFLSGGSHDIWIDHNDFSNACDKAIGANGGVTAMTISWNHFFNQKQVIQFGSDATRGLDGVIKATVHHNFFDRVGYRNPRLSYGQVHAYDNYLLAWDPRHVLYPYRPATGRGQCLRTGTQPRRVSTQHRSDGVPRQSGRRSPERRDQGR